MIKFSKKIIYFLLEIAYLLVNIGYMYYMYNEFGNTISYDFNFTIFTCLISLLICITLIAGPLLNKLFTYLYVFILSMYLITQRIYFDAFGQYYRIGYAMSLLKEMSGVKESVNEFLNINYFLPLVFLTIVNTLFIIAYFAIQRKSFRFLEKTIIFVVSLIISFFIVRPIGEKITIMQENIIAMNNGMGGFEYSDDYHLYDKVTSTKEFVERFGILTFAYRDLDSIFSERTLSENDLKLIHDFFDERSENLSENEYTGIFKDKNIIFVQAESFMNVAIDEELTPILYMIKNNSLSINNFLTPTLAGSTSDTEFMANTSIIPYSNEKAGCYEFENNVFKTTLASMFKDNGYVTSVYHNNYGSYYNRDVIFKTLGYDIFLDSYELGVKDATPDGDIGLQIGQCFAFDEKKHMEYWITYSGHQPYNYDSTAVTEENVSKILNKYPNLEEKYVAYLAKAMDLDRALDDYLKVYSYGSGLNDLVLVLFGDHQAKGLDFSSGSSFYDETGLEFDNDYICTGMYFYNNGNYVDIYNKKSTVLDLLPTVANMFGFKIDNKTIIGKDMFDENYHGFYFSDFGIIETDNIVYSSDNDGIVDRYNNALKSEELESVKKEIKRLKDTREISTMILQTNYFKED